MYLEMVRGTEKAINALIDVQQKCEEMYISSPEAKITVLPKTDGRKEQKGTAPDA